MTWHEAISTLEEEAVRAAWRQWVTCGGPISSTEKARNLIDPEALILLSLVLQNRERRFRDLLAWAAVRHSKLLSVQRINNISKAFPPSIHEKRKDFAYWAVKRGGDLRWKLLAGGEPAYSVREQKITETDLHILDSPNLFFRMRLALGVGVKADVLSLLIGKHGSPLSLYEIAASTAYTERAVRRSLQDLSESELIRAQKTGVRRFSIDIGKWYEFLDLDWVKEMALNISIPHYRNFHAIFAFIAKAIFFKEQYTRKHLSPYVASSRLRDLILAERSSFDLNQIMIPNEQAYPGEKFLDAFEEILASLAVWLENEV
jgi:hypothetical protein